MADESAQNQGQQGGNDTGGTTSDAGTGFKAITTQADLDKVVGDRVARERAKFADYSDLKAKAAKLDEIEQANRTEADKAADRLAKLEERATKAERDALRSRIQARHAISDEDAELFLTGADEETLTKQAERLAARNEDAGKSRPPKPDPNQGKPSASAGDPSAEFAAFIGNQLAH
jgi:hypothetical protein